jgi:hypothetical protein
VVQMNVVAVLITHLARATDPSKNNSSTRWKRLFSFKPRPNYLRWKSKVRTKRIDRAYSISKSENPRPRRKHNSGLIAYSPLTVLAIPTLQTLITRYMLRLRYYCSSRVENDCSPKHFNSVISTNHGIIVRKIPILPLL